MLSHQFLLEMGNGSIGMKKFLTIALYGLVLWLIPFLAGIPFVDERGDLLIPENFFKSIMIVIGSLVGVILAVRYFRTISVSHQLEGILLGTIWLVISLGLDLILVTTGFFPLTLSEYLTEIGLRYLSIPIYTTGLGYALSEKTDEMRRPASNR